MMHRLIVMVFVVQPSTNLVDLSKKVVEGGETKKSSCSAVRKKNKTLVQQLDRIKTLDPVNIQLEIDLNA